MIAVGGIVVDQLPISEADHAMRATLQFQGRAGPAVEPFVDQLRGRAEMRDEVRHLRVQRRKDEAAIARDPRLAEAERRLVEAGAVAFLDRHADQRAGAVERPVVIGTGEAPRRALVLAAHGGATMGAAVEQHVQRAVAVAADDHRPQAELATDEAVRRRQLALMGEKGPGAAEHAVHLVGEDRLVGVERAVDAMLLHQRVERQFRWMAHAISSKPAGRRRLALASCATVSSA